MPSEADEQADDGGGREPLLGDERADQRDEQRLGADDQAADAGR